MRIVSLKTNYLEGEWSNKFRLLDHGRKQASKNQIVFKSIVKNLANGDKD